MSYYSDVSPFEFPPVRADGKKYNKLYWPLMVCLAIGLVVYIIAMATLSVGARYFAFMFTAVANGARLQAQSGN